MYAYTALGNHYLWPWKLAYRTASQCLPCHPAIGSSGRTRATSHQARRPALLSQLYRHVEATLALAHPNTARTARMMSWSGASTCGWSHRWRPAQPALASPDPRDAQSCSPLRARPVSGSDQEPYSGSCQRSTLAADCGGLTGGVGWVKRLSQASLSVLSLLSRRPPAQCWPSSTC